MIFNFKDQNFFHMDIKQEQEKFPLKQNMDNINLEKDQLKKLANQKTIKNGQKTYRLNIDDTVMDALLNGELSKEKLEKVFKDIENDKVYEKVVGFFIGLFDGELFIETFLGNNAE